MIKDLLIQSAVLLESVSSTPYLDAELLLCFVLKVDRSWLIGHSDEVVSGVDQSTFKELLLRRKNHEPLAYITGKKFFFDSEFIVSPSVLIPRPETEILVEKAFEKAKELYLKNKKPLSIIDLGTGSGCIGISLLLLLEQNQIPIDVCILSDISSDALVMAEQNARQLLSNESFKKIQFIVSNWFSTIVGSFDLIVSNPPYIARNDSRLYEGSRYEPEGALFSSNCSEGEGLEDIKTIISAASEKLRPFADLLLECGDGQAESALKLAKQFGLETKIYFDISGKGRGIQSTNN